MEDVLLIVEVRAPVVRVVLVIVKGAAVVMVQKNGM